ncbi:uncharacterized protein LOC124358133 [Homalodisca vitripennis]|uniref:uncharacterized protein LOC124358133 n=1 Tax=Homalodisca vitripennis TaxID=197043 RepID=UPI001EEC389A|nr:uncharacterized protein LOC124358133 [Homalodisca vitripennis]
MSRNFSANQLEREFRPTRLGNWEVPKWLPQRPRARKTTTKIIANDRGHLLPGVQRPPQNPWGSFRGTWQLPNKISRKYASELTRPTGALTSWEKRSAHVPIIEPTKLPPARPKSAPSFGNSNKELDDFCKVHKEPVEHNLKQIEYRESPRKLSPLPINDRQLYDKHDENDYSRTLAYDRAPQVVNTSQNVQDDINEYTKTVQSPLLEEKRNGFKRDPSPPDSGVDLDYPPQGPPLASVYCSAQVAKNLALDNQKHQPLPDTIEDALYRSMQLKQAKHPGMGLNVEPRALAVGVKGYGAPAPTQCSKLKVYRPKTAGALQRRESHDEVRPKTSQPKRKEHMSEIELALCWDFKPVNPSDEPKRSPHIDGSNGSAAPAVFAMVHQPSPIPPEDARPSPRPSLEQKKMEKRLSADTIKSISRESADRARSRPKTAWSDDTKAKHLQERLKKLQERSNPSAVMDIINNNAKENSSPNILPGESRKSSAASHDSRRKSLSGQHSIKSSELDSQKLSKEKHYQSSPNLTTAGVHTNGKNGKNRLLNSRPCMACDLKTSPPGSLQEAKRPKSDYKMAFKAGKPNGSGNDNLNGSQDVSSTSSRPHTAKQLQIPKMKAPFAKKSYSIGTLAPPFSLWPGTTGQDYPEHWRLASVYQHSFKPVELRRKPLLQSVYQ